jgi:pimeloyl-[acyl-carrier protein] methyl ester esterase
MIGGDNLDQIVLVGWSMGGLIALQYCAQFACRGLAGLVIVDVAPRTTPDTDWVMGTHLHPAFAAQADRWRALWPADREAVVREVTELAFADPEAHRGEVDRLVKSARNADEAAALGAFTEIAKTDFRPVLSQVSVPTLLVFGERSTSTTPCARKYMVDHLPHATTRVFNACGHAVMIEDPGGFNDVVREFASSLLAA